MSEQVGPRRAAVGEPAPDLRELAQFDGPPEEFLPRLLAAQCRLAHVRQAVILRAKGEDQADVIAAFPPPTGDELPPWTPQAARNLPEVLESGASTVNPLHAPDDLYGQGARRHLVLVPLQATGLRAAAAFLIEARDRARIRSLRQQLETTAAYLHVYELRRALTRREGDFERLRDAMEILAAVNQPNRFMAAAMALCNETASRWNADRVSLGFLKGRYVRLRAMSRTEKFSRKMKLVQDIEAAMEECLDQDAEVVHPAAAESTVVSRAAAELARRHGPSAIVSLPLRADGEPVAVLTVERAADRPFDVAEVEALRLTCELCTPRVLDLHRHDKWFGAKAAGAVRKGLAALVGPKHTWAKIAAILVLAAAGFLVFARGDYTVDAPFSLEPIQRRVAPAPFQGYIHEVFVEPDDDVEKGQPLAALKTNELLDQLTRAMAKRTTHLKEKDLALRENKRAEANIALERVKEVEAEIRLLRHKIEQATIVAPIGGKVISGDLAEEIGAPVETGQVLFEIAPVESLRAELHVPEDDVAEIELGQTGELATETYPGRRFRFEVTRIHPVAQVVKENNVFKVRAELVRFAPWMRPNMQGVAKIKIDRRRYAWIWTHDVVDWIRMKLWL